MSDQSTQQSRSVLQNPALQHFIQENAELFWFIPAEKKLDISEACLVETILNYGSMDAVRRLFHLMGINAAAKIFYDSIQESPRRQGNYHELTRNYFNLVFQKYAS